MQAFALLPLVTFVSATGTAWLLVFVSLMFKEFMAGCSHHGDEGHKFLEVTLAIAIFIQCFHDFVHDFLLFDFLRERERKKNRKVD